MPTWLLIVLVVVAVLAAGAFRERWRLSGMETWSRTRGFEVLAAVTGSDSDARLPARLGISAAESATHRLTTGGRLLVEGEPRLREAWLTDARRRVLEQWPHGGAFVIDKGWAAWRMRGLLTPARLDELLRQLSEARRALE